jgi:hypothetical protein
MTHFKIALICGIALATTNCAPANMADTPAPIAEKEAKLLDKELTGKVAGKSVSCISTPLANEPIRISDDMLLYRVSSRLVYQNRLRGQCSGLVRRDDIMVTEIFGGQYCRGDIIRLVDRTSGIPGGFCVLGDFTPYRKDPSVAAQ